MRKTQEVFIGSTFTAMAAGDVNVSALAAGAMVAYNQDRDGAISTADQYFSIAQADTDFQSRSSMPIYLGQIKRVTKKAYAAATKQQTTLTIAAADVSNNAEYTIGIGRNNQPDFVNAFRQYASIISQAAATNVNIATDIVAKVNADPSLPVTAANGGTNVITFTSKSPVDTFTIFKAVGLSSASVVALTVAADPGSGTLAQVRAHELLSVEYRGNINRSEFTTPYRSYVNAAAGYVQYTIEHAERTDIDLSNTSNEAIVDLTVYIDKDAAGANFTNFEAIFTAIGVPVTTITG